MEAGQEQNPGPENQDNQHMLEQPRGYFPDFGVSKVFGVRGVRQCRPHVSSQSEYHLCWQSVEPVVGNPVRQDNDKIVGQSKILKDVPWQQGQTSGSKIAKKIFWWNFCSSFKDHYKIQSSNELFCNNIGQDLSGPIRANRFSRFSLRRNLFSSRIDLPAARTGRESREFQCESERRRDSRESGQVVKDAQNVQPPFGWL